MPVNVHVYFSFDRLELHKPLINPPFNDLLGAPLRLLLLQLGECQSQIMNGCLRMLGIWANTNTIGVAQVCCDIQMVSTLLGNHVNCRRTQQGLSVPNSVREKTYLFLCQSWLRRMRVVRIGNTDV